MRPVLVAILFLLLELPASAQVPWCGTGGAASQRASAVGKWVAARDAARLGKGGDPIATVNDSIVVLQSDDRNTPFRRPFDLAGRSLVFMPSDGGYRVSNVALVWDDGPSIPVVVQRTTYPAAALRELNFGFPFAGVHLAAIYIADDNALYIDLPKPGNVQGQYLDLDLATTRQQMISPLLMPQLAFGFDQPPPAIAMHQTATTATFTWTSTGTRSRYDVQATLFADGTIRFSYRSAERVPAGAIVIRSGAETWSAQKTEIARVPDAADDATGAPVDVLPSLGIRSVDVDRIADSNLLELRIELGAAPDRAKLSEDAIYTVDIAGFDVILRTTLSRDGSRDEYFVPINGSLAFGTAARIEGNAIVMDFLEEMLPPPWTAVPMTISTRFGRTLAPADSVTKLLSFAPPACSVATDFSSIANDTPLNGPIAEAFTLPVLNPEGTWEEVKSLYKLNDSSFDGVAIYQNFDTDITLTFVSAYSTIGNPLVTTGNAAGSATYAAGCPPKLGLRGVVRDGRQPLHGKRGRLVHDAADVRLVRLQLARSLLHGSRVGIRGGAVLLHRELVARACERLLAAGERARPRHEEAGDDAAGARCDGPARPCLPRHAARVPRADRAAGRSLPRGDLRGTGHAAGDPADVRAPLRRRDRRPRHARDRFRAAAPATARAAASARRRPLT